MQATECRISDRLREALLRDFAPFTTKIVHGDPLPYWLQSSETNALPPMLSFQLCRALENALALEGAPNGEGSHILQAFDDLINHQGSPAVVIRGLPLEKDCPGISNVLLEAFRQYLHPDPNRHSKQDFVFDKPAATSAGYKKDGFTHLHHDPSDHFILYCMQHGDNPRHTAVYDSDDFVRHLVERAENHAPKPFTAERRAELTDHFVQLLELPIWPLKSEEAKKAAALGTVHSVMSRHGEMFDVAPFLYPAGADAGVSHYFFPVPFAEIHYRVNSTLVDLKGIPAALKDDATMLFEEIFYATHDEVAEKTGPVLQAGDLLIGDNTRIMHGGGPFVHAHLPKEQRTRTPRKLLAADCVRSKESYAIHPSDRWVEAIVPAENELGPRR